MKPQAKKAPRDLKAAKAKPEARKATWENMGLKPTCKRAPAKAKPAAAAKSDGSSDTIQLGGWTTASQETAEKENERLPKRQKHKEDEKEKEQEMKKLQLPLLPGHLEDKGLKMYTVGCKGVHSLETILDKWRLPKRKTLLIDCRDLVGPRTNAQGHYGASTRAIKNTMKLDMGPLGGDVHGDLQGAL